MKKKLPKVDPYIDGLMAKLLERLVSIEKKVDALSGRGPVRAEAKPQPLRHERMLYEAVCADCHKVCEVPFRPSEDRAVYCKECWAHRKGGPISKRPGMPVLTPVSLSPKPTGNLSIATQAVSPVRSLLKKVKKAKIVKKNKRK